MRAVLLAPALLAIGATACGRDVPPAAPADESASATPAATAMPKLSAQDAPLRAALQIHHWQLQRAHDAHGTALRSLFVDGMPPLQLDFTAQRLQVSQTCNALGAAYTVEAAHLQIGRVVSSKRLCAQSRRMAQEHAASDLLSGRFAVALDSAAPLPTLRLTRTDGTRLEFAGQPTADARFGGPGQTVWLEVAGDTAPCTTEPTRQCLKVREYLQATQAVLQDSADGWQPLDQPIEGFTHEPGIRTLLRVTRYPASGDEREAPVYVLEQLLEARG
ncbi:META domain-containing protein [Xanthomonas campestris]|uniref:META domain-containing protein n=1 Tax=Xanthomonas campestris TaxID=339 RepID=UPI002377D67A|nr:META domain-containing protein [Xanthomonas campestris]WDK00707.1 META domain-containing protein [Xanthomonas campestris]